jgi:hypothetical protein
MRTAPDTNMDLPYPIIRRQRRPLAVVDAPPAIASNVELVQPAAAAPAVEPEKQTQSEANDEETDY